MHQSFSATEAIAFSWRAVTSNLGKFIGIVAMLFLVNTLSAIILWFLKDYAWLDVPFRLAFSVINVLLAIGIVQVCLRVVDGKTFKVLDIITTDIYLVFRFFAVSFLVGLIVILGYICLIIPGIILTLKYGLSYIFLIDQNLSIGESIAKCGKATTGSKWQLFFLGLLTLGINIVGFMCFGTGVLISVSMSYVAMAYAYRCISPLEVAEVAAAPNVQV